MVLINKIFGKHGVFEFVQRLTTQVDSKVPKIEFRLKDSVAKQRPPRGVPLVPILT